MEAEGSELAPAVRRIAPYSDPGASSVAPAVSENQGKLTHRFLFLVDVDLASEEMGRSHGVKLGEFVHKEFQCHARLKILSMTNRFSDHQECILTEARFNPK